MTDEELKVAIASDSLWENAVQLSDNLEEYSIFWQVLKRDTAENQMHLLFVASKLDDIDNYLNIVRQQDSTQLLLMFAVLQLEMLLH